MGRYGIFINIKNPVILFEKNKKSAGFYVLLYSLIIEVFKNVYLNSESRLMLADLYIFMVKEPKEKILVSRYIKDGLRVDKN